MKSMCEIANCEEVHRGFEDGSEGVSEWRGEVGVTGGSQRVQKRFQREVSDGGSVEGKGVEEVVNGF